MILAQVERAGEVEPRVRQVGHELRRALCLPCRAGGVPAVQQCPGVRGGDPARTWIGSLGDLEHPARLGPVSASPRLDTALQIRLGILRIYPECCREEHAIALPLR